MCVFQLESVADQMDSLTSLVTDVDINQLSVQVTTCTNSHLSVCP